ncbi:unknown [Clostridium sp. CAG:242]|nr:unknown [Clostridium sp. CAG:242]
MRFTLFSTAGTLSSIIFDVVAISVVAIWFYIKRTAFLMSLAISSSTITLSSTIFSRLIGSVVVYLVHLYR